VLSPQKTTQSLKTEARLKRENNIGYILCKVRVEMASREDKHIKIKPRICVLCLTWTMNANLLQTKKYNDYRNTFLAAILDGQIGDSVYGKKMALL